jgi:hypothetical protein
VERGLDRGAIQSFSVRLRRSRPAPGSGSRLAPRSDAGSAEGSESSRHRQFLGSGADRGDGPVLDRSEVKLLLALAMKAVVGGSYGDGREMVMDVLLTAL